MKVCMSSENSIYLKGKKFLYSIERTETWNASYGRIIYHIYSMDTNSYLLELDEKRFHKYFFDLEDYREKQLEKILK